MTAASVGKSDKPKLTKRQQRKKGPNPSNTWQQQPKIKSMESRDRAKLRSAGFTKSRKIKESEVINPDADFINSPEYKFGRLLASPSARTRHATILKLKEYLKARTEPSNEGGGLSVLDLMKLWKGMWHTLYLCDGVAVQEEVSKVLAELMWSVGGSQEEDEYAGRFYLEMEEGEQGEPAIDDIGDSEVKNDDGDDDEIRVIEMEESEDENDEDEEGGEDQDEDQEMEGNPAEEENVKHCRGAHLSALYVRTFFRTLMREWSNMDKYRIDKFYTLSRLMLRESYRYMASRHWNLGIIRLFNDALFEEVLRNTKYGNGVKFHLLDICLPELAKVNAEEQTGLPLTEATFLDALEPFFALAQRVEDKITQGRVMENVISKFLDEFSVVSDNFDVPEDGDEAAQTRKNLVMDQVHVGTVGQFIFELASDKETSDRYRKGLYDMHKTYLKRVKAIGRDVDIEIKEDEDDEDMEDDGVPEEEAEEVEEEPEAEPEPAPEIEPETKKSKKKKKKKKSKSKKDDEEAIATEIVETTPQKEKKSKKKKRESDAKEEATEGFTTPEKETPSKKRKKSKPKKEIELTDEEEEIITISKKEQKAATKAIARAAAKADKAAKAKAEAKAEEDRQSEGSKKVKFGKMNQSKSYKASMKDLKKINAKEILEKTPDKSILLKKQPKKKRKSQH